MKLSPNVEKQWAEACRQLVNHYGRVGFEAYAKSTDGKTYDGRPMPLWHELPPDVQQAWRAAAEAIRAVAPAGTAEPFAI